MIGLSSDSAARAKTTHSNLGTKNMADSKLEGSFSADNSLLKNSQLPTVIKGEKWSETETHVLPVSTVTVNGELTRLTPSSVMKQALAGVSVRE